jgi:hypothetical protein
MHHTPANLRDLAYNQMKQQYVEARSRAGGRSAAALHAGEGRRPSRLPLARYDRLKAIDVIHRIDALADDELLAVRGYEEQHRHRTTVLRSIERRLAHEGCTRRR